MFRFKYKKIQNTKNKVRSPRCCSSKSSQWMNWYWHAHACVDTYVPVRTQEGEGRVNSEFQKGRECFFQLINQYIKVCIKKLILKLCILRLQTNLHVLQARMFYLFFWICSLVHLPFSAQRSAITVQGKMDKMAIFDYIVFYMQFSSCAVVKCVQVWLHARYSLHISIKTINGVYKQWDCCSFLVNLLCLNGQCVCRGAFLCTSFPLPCRGHGHTSKVFKTVHKIPVIL